MICKAIKVTGPSQWQLESTQVEDCGRLIKVRYSSICRTDFSVIDGSLPYYKNNIAKYPIITGHEWCGEYEGQPVVGLCILGCQECDKCKKGQLAYCETRTEVGIVNKNGAHAQYVSLPEWAIVPVPSYSMDYAMVEPLAVVLHGLNRIPIDKDNQILISGYGSIGKMVAHVLKFRGFKFDIFDVKFKNKIDWKKYDVLIECSGFSDSVNSIARNKGAKILLFGFEYDEIWPKILVANEVNIYTSLGSSREDFDKAISMLPLVPITWINGFSLSKFSDALSASKNGMKIIMNNWS